MASALRVMVIVMNVIVLFLGLASMVVGIWAYVRRADALQLAKVDDDATYSDIELPGFLQVVAGACVATGVGLMVMATLGICGAGKDSKCLLALGTGLLVLFILLQGCIVGFAVVTRNRVRSNLKAGLLQGISVHYEGHINSDMAFSHSLDRAMVMFECCGIDNYTDFQSATLWADRTSLQVPKACCKLDKDQYLENRIYIFMSRIICAQFPNTTISNIGQACYEDIQEWVDETVDILLAVSILVIFAELVSLMVAFCLIRNMKAHNKFYYEE